MSAEHSLQALESLSTFTLKGLPSACVAPNFGGWGLIIKVLGIAFFQKGEVLKGLKKWNRINFLLLVICVCLFFV